MVFIVEQAYIFKWDGHDFCMTIDYLVQKLTAENIDLAPYEVFRGCILPNGLMFVNQNQAREQLILTVLHEIYHLHPSFFPYTQRLWAGDIQRNEDIEGEITRMAEETFIARQDIVTFIEHKLKEAAERPLNTHA